MLCKAAISSSRALKRDCRTRLDTHIEDCILFVQSLCLCGVTFERVSIILRHACRVLQAVSATATAMERLIELIDTWLLYKALQS